MATATATVTATGRAEISAYWSDYVSGPDALRMHRLRHKRKAKEILVLAPIRSGKTLSIVFEAATVAWNNELDGGTFIGAPTYGMLRPLLMRPILSILERAGLIAEKNLSNGEARLKSRAGFSDESRWIFFRSLEVPDHYRGLTVGPAFVDEAAYCQRYSIDILRERQLTTDGPLYMATTPKGRQNWVYNDYFAPGAEHRDDPYFKYVRYSIYNNPRITKKAVERLRMKFDKRLAAQEIDAEFIDLFEDLVYYAFHEVNVGRYKFNPNIPVYVGLDYNVGINAWCAVQRIGPATWAVVDEGEGLLSTKEVGRDLLDRFGPEVNVIDDASSGNARQQGDGRTNRQILAQVGIKHIASNTRNPLVQRRVTVVNACFEDGLGNNHLFIDENCVGTINELSTITYKEGTVKVDDQQRKRGHRTDALGYAVMWVTGGVLGWDVKAPENRAAATFRQLIGR